MWLLQVPQRRLGACLRLRVRLRRPVRDGGDGGSQLLPRGVAGQGHARSRPPQSDARRDSTDCMSLIVWV